MLNYALENYVTYSYKEIITSAKGHDLPINVYEPKVKNDLNETAVVCIHGGAWTSKLKNGSEWESDWMRHNASILASIGYLAVEITYRSINDTSINGVISDAKEVFKAVKNVIMPRHGAKKLYATGDSAGGHLALMSAIFEDQSLRPEKVVACNPVTDLTDKKWQLGTTTEKERYEASPLYRNDKTDTKIILIHGESDRTVPIEASVLLKKHLDTLGISCIFEALPDATHAFILYGYRTPIDKVNEYMEKVLT